MQSNEAPRRFVSRRELLIGAGAIAAAGTAVVVAGPTAVSIFNDWQEQDHANKEANRVRIEALKREVLREFGISEPTRLIQAEERERTEAGGGFILGSGIFHQTESSIMRVTWQTNSESPVTKGVDILPDLINWVVNTAEEHDGDLPTIQFRVDPKSLFDGDGNFTVDAENPNNVIRDADLVTIAMNSRDYSSFLSGQLLPHFDQTPQRIRGN